MKKNKEVASSRDVLEFVCGKNAHTCWEMHGGSLGILVAGIWEPGPSRREHLRKIMRFTFFLSTVMG